MLSESMESLGIYGELPLFSGEHLLEDVNQPAFVDYVPPSLGQDIQDGLLVSTSPGIDVVPIKTKSVTHTLAHPQNGSNELGLEDLLGGSPTQDLSNPFSPSTVWMDHNMELFDFLDQEKPVPQIPAQQQHFPMPAAVQPMSTVQHELVSPAVQQDIHQEVQPVSILMLPDQQQQQLSASPEPAAIYYPDSPEAAIVPNVNVDVELNSNFQQTSHVEFEDIEDLLSFVESTADTNTANVSSDSGIELSSSFGYNSELPQNLSGGVTSQEINLLDEINEAGLDALTTSLSDDPILSPVSADEIESILSSGPPSPSSEPFATTTALSSLFTSDVLSTISDSSVQSCRPEVSLGSSCQKSPREKVRPTPYPQTTPAPKSSGRRTKADRKERKKEQNRTAALRYREKKRQENDVLMLEANELEAKNKVLRDKVDSITREIKYLKDLMAEVERVRKAQAKK